MHKKSKGTWSYTRVPVIARAEQYTSLRASDLPSKGSLIILSMHTHLGNLKSLFILLQRK